MKKLITALIPVMLILVAISCTSTPLERKDNALAVALESWQIGETWQYSQQSIWNDIFVGVEYIFVPELEGQFISSYNLRTREKKRLLEFDTAEFRISPPSIYENLVVWSSTDISGKPLSEIDWDEIDRDVFLLDLDTGEIEQITNEEHAQIEPRVYGDTIIWLDTRHVESYHNPDVFDLYAYDLRTNKETRLTSSTSVEDNQLVINGNLIVWSDNRHADPEVTIHAGNEPNYNNEIYVYDLDTNKEQRITNYAGNDHYPAIDGSRIVWLRQFTFREAEVFLYDLNSGQETQISHNQYAAYNPDISASWIVWADSRISLGNTAGDTVSNGIAGAAEIYHYDLHTELETLLVPAEETGQMGNVVFRQVWLDPVIHGDFIVYTFARGVGPIIYAMRLTEK